MAYCLDQAVGHFGVVVESELEQAGHKPDKSERKITAARKAVLNRYFGDKEVKPQSFADPAALFS